jgi:hypothetical protein
MRTASGRAGRKKLRASQSASRRSSCSRWRAQAVATWHRLFNGDRERQGNPYLFKNDSTPEKIRRSRWERAQDR